MTTEPISHRRMAENQVVFRARNRKMQSWFTKFKKIARKEVHGTTSLDNDKPMSFYCECSDEKCTQRIELPPTTYRDIHAAPDLFTIACGHEVPEIEDIVIQQPTYCVVKKHLVPDQSPGKLQPTPVDNT